MKSPREILLDHHSEKSFELDQVRRQVLVTELAKNEANWVDALRGWLSLNRIVWTAFATAWVAIIALNVAADRTGGTQVATRPEIQSSDARVRWQDYRAQLSLLLIDEHSAGSSELDTAEDLPGPRSDVPGFRRFSHLGHTNIA